MREYLGRQAYGDTFHALCQQYEKQMQAVFGPACCNRLYIRPVGGYLLKED